MLSKTDKRKIYSRVVHYLRHTGGATIASIKRDVSKDRYVCSVVKDLIKKGLIRIMQIGGWDVNQARLNVSQNFSVYTGSGIGSKMNTYPREIIYVPIN